MNTKISKDTFVYINLGTIISIVIVCGLFMSQYFSLKAEISAIRHDLNKFNDFRIQQIDHLENTIKYKIEIIEERIKKNNNDTRGIYGK